VLTDGAFRIPSIYLHDWPDRYIHTDRDVPANIDPTKLKRAGFIGGAAAWYLANLSAPDEALFRVLSQKRLERTARMLGRKAVLPDEEAAALARFHWAYERAMLESVARFVPLDEGSRTAATQQIDGLAQLYGDGGEAPVAQGAVAVVYRRGATPKGPMVVFGYDYLVDHFGKAQTAALALPAYEACEPRATRTQSRLSISSTAAARCRKSAMR
jgi:hypothetical protein